MKALLKRLSIGQRLLLIVYTSLFFLCTIAFVFWHTSTQSEYLEGQIQTYSTFRTDVAETKRFYNALRAELALALSVNPALEPDKATQLRKWFTTRQHQLSELVIKANTYQGLSPSVINYRGEFAKQVTAFSAISQQNFEKVLTTATTDTVAYHQIKEFVFGEYANSFQSLLDQAKKLEVQLDSEIYILFAKSAAQNETVRWMTLVFIAIIGVILFAISNLVIQSITRPVNQAKTDLQKLSHGELPSVTLSDGKDEISSMTLSLQEMAENQKKLMGFTHKVAQNDFSVEASMYNGQGPIVESLVQMRNSLKESAQKETQKNWHNEGLSKLSQLLRKKEEDLADIYASIIQFLVKYVKANQGSFFHTQKQGTEKMLELGAAYAYDRQKYIQKTLHWGEGLIGAACQEKDIIFLTDLPNEYIHITSGLGTASPKCLILVPLIADNEVEGVIELASFHVLAPYQIEFLKEAATAIATELAVLNTGQKIRLLLEASQQQGEMLKSQEEEMRQNMEEMAATQEEMLRKEQELVGQNSALNNAAIVSEVNLQGNIIFVNDEFCRIAKYTREELMGQKQSIIRHPDMTASLFEDLWRTISRGKVWKGEIKNRAKDGSAYWVDVTITPVLGSNGKPIKYIGVRFDITKQMQLAAELEDRIQKSAM